MVFPYNKKWVFFGHSAAYQIYKVVSDDTKYLTTSGIKTLASTQQPYRLWLNKCT
jgi:hypothetical protein